jgi:HPt (histidine-containing phosphotransfer) domain-containing protein
VLTLDPRALANIEALQREGAPDIVAKIARIFLDSSPKLVEGLTGAVSGSDPGKVVSTAHSLKSSSANLGAIAFSDLCREFEAAAKQGRLPDMDQLERMNQLYGQVCEALEQLVSDRAA